MLDKFAEVKILLTKKESLELCEMIETFINNNNDCETWKRKLKKLKEIPNKL